VEATDRLQELGSSCLGGTRRRPAVSARARGRQAIWDTTVLVGAVISTTAALLNVLIEESIQLRVISALIFATTPAAAALVVGAMLVTLLGLLGITYDLIRTLVVPGLLYCVCSGTPLLLDGTCRLKEYISTAFGRTAGGLMQFARGLAIPTRRILRGAGTPARSGLEWMSREIALEALWIKQGVRRVLGVTASIACWPIRTSALLILRLIERNQFRRAPLGSLGGSSSGIFRGTAIRRSEGLRALHERNTPPQPAPGVGRLLRSFGATARLTDEERRSAEHVQGRTVDAATGSSRPCAAGTAWV